jgi:hypothetical protein
MEDLADAPDGFDNRRFQERGEAKPVQTWTPSTSCGDLQQLTATELPLRLPRCFVGPIIIAIVSNRRSVLGYRF